MGPKLVCGSNMGSSKKGSSKTSRRNTPTRALERTCGEFLLRMWRNQARTHLALDFIGFSGEGVPLITVWLDHIANAWRASKNWHICVEKSADINWLTNTLFLASSTLPLTRLQLLRSPGGNLDLPVRATRKACWLVGRRRNTPAGSSALSERRAGCRRRS